MAKRQPRLQKRGSRYCLRVKAPKELHSFIGKKEIHKSLGASDLAEARRLLHIENFKIDAQFTSARLRLKLIPVRTLSRSEADWLALEWFHDADRERLRTEHMPLSSADRPIARENLEETAAALADPTDPGCLSAVQAVMHKQESTAEAEMPM